MASISSAPFCVFQNQEESIPHVRQDLIMRAMMRDMGRRATSPHPRRRTRRDGSRRHLNAMSDESVNTAPTVNSTPIRMPSHKKDTTIELSQRSLQSFPSGIAVKTAPAKVSPDYPRRTNNVAVQSESSKGYRYHKHLEVPVMETEGCPEDVLSPTTDKRIPKTQRTSAPVAPGSPRSPIDRCEAVGSKNAKNKVFKDIKPILDHDKARRMSFEGIPTSMRKTKSEDMRLKRTHSEARLATGKGAAAPPSKPTRSNSLPRSMDAGRNTRRNVVKQLLPTGQLIEPRRLPLCAAYDDDFNDWASASSGTLGSHASSSVLVDDGFGTICRNETFLRRQRSAPAPVRGKLQ